MSAMPLPPPPPPPPSSASSLPLNSSSPIADITQRTTYTPPTSSFQDPPKNAPGWNDCPAVLLKGSKKKRKYVAPQSPYVHQD